MVGLLDLFVLGFFIGSIFAYLRNLAVLLSARVIHRDIELYHLRRFFDFIIIRSVTSGFDILSTCHHSTGH